MLGVLVVPEQQGVDMPKLMPGLRELNTLEQELNDSVLKEGSVAAWKKVDGKYCRVR